MSRRRNLLLKRNGNGNRLPSYGLLRAGSMVDTVGTSTRENQLRQYGTFLNGETLTSASIVGTETVISSEGTCTPVISAGTITFDAGTCWNIVLSNGSTYSHPTKTGAAAGIWFDRSGAGIHLTVNVADIDAHCSEGIEFGSNTLELEGWTEGETDGIELVNNGDFEGTFTDGLAYDWEKLSTVVVSESSLSHSGAKAQQFTNSSSSGARIAPLTGCPIIAGQPYLFSVWARSLAGTLNLGISSTALALSKTVQVTEEYQLFTYECTAISTVLVKPIFYSYNINNIIIIDDFSLQWIPQGKIPLLSDLSASCLNQTPTYTGRAKYSLTPKNAPCATFDGTAGDYISIAGLTGSETVTSSGGTSTPSISAGKIDFTAGTCWDLQLSNGMIFPLSESAGTTVYGYDSEGNTYTGTITASDIGAFWGSTQDSYFHDWEYGRELSGSVRIPGNPYTGLSCASNDLTTAPYQLTANDWSFPETGELRDADGNILADTASRFIYDTDGATPLDWNVADITDGNINNQIIYGNNKASVYEDAQEDPALTKILKYHGLV